MTEEQRIALLDTARRRAAIWAESAEDALTGEEQDLGEEYIVLAQGQSLMWAHVAQAMKE